MRGWRKVDEWDLPSSGRIDESRFRGIAVPIIPRADPEPEAGHDAWLAGRHVGGPRIPRVADPAEDPMDPGPSRGLANLKPKPGPAEPRRCTATNRGGERCRKWPMRGGTVCHMHGGRRQRERIIREKAEAAALKITDEILDFASRGATTKGLPRRQSAFLRDLRAGVRTQMRADRDGLTAMKALVVNALAAGQTALQVAEAFRLDPETVYIWAREDIQFRRFVELKQSLMARPESTERVPD